MVPDLNKQLKVHFNCFFSISNVVLDEGVAERWRRLADSARVVHARASLLAGIQENVHENLQLKNLFKLFV